MCSLSEARVLVVDDEPDLCEMLAFEFELQGSKALHAYNGRGALHIVESTPIDAVVTDLRMSEGDGLDLLDSIRLRNPETPCVIFITAYDTDLTPADAYDRGAEGIFAKPFPLKDLVDRVRFVLASPEKRWSTPIPEKVSHAITCEFHDLESARRGRVFSLGRGGMAVVSSDIHPAMDERVSFTVRLDDGPLSSISGVGTVRWTTQTSDRKSHVCGIEFDYLDDPSRVAVIRWLKAAQCRPFIPRL